MTPRLEKKRSCMMMWHFSPCHTNLGPHNIHVKKNLTINYLMQHVIVQND
jgi:hypothetical protein